MNALVVVIVVTYVCESTGLGNLRTSWEANVFKRGLVLILKATLGITFYIKKKKNE